MSIKTLSSGTNVVEYMPMTTKAIPCPAYQQILSNVGFQEGQGSGEKAGSIPQASVLKDMNHNVRKTRNQRVGGRYKREKQPGYKCNEENRDQRYAVTNFGGDLVSAPAFEIRWRSKDLSQGTADTGSPSSDSEDWPAGTMTITTDSQSLEGSSRKAGTTKSAEPTKTSGSRYGNLSERAMVGITTGAVLGFLVLIAVLVMRCKTQRKRASGGHVSSAGIRGTTHNATSQSQSQQPVDCGPAELSNDAALPSELAATQPIGTVWSLTNPLEMSGGYNEPAYAESAPAELSGETRHEGSAEAEQTTPKSPA